MEEAAKEGMLVRNTAALSMEGEIEEEEEGEEGEKEVEVEEENC